RRSAPAVARGTTGPVRSSASPGSPTGRRPPARRTASSASADPSGGAVREPPVLLGLELVAETADGHDVAGLARVRLDLGAQTPDVDVDELAVAEVVVAPDPVEQPLPGEH